MPVKLTKYMNKLFGPVEIFVSLFINGVSIINLSLS